MMARTLADNLASDLYDVLNPNEHGEWITYAQEGRQPRRLVALVKQKETAEEKGGYRYQSELITVVVGNDPDNAKGGVLQPTVNPHSPRDADKITRGTDKDGFISHDVASLIELDGGWEIEFRRIKAGSIGN